MDQALLWFQIRLMKYLLALFYKIFIIVYCPASPASLCLVATARYFRLEFPSMKEKKEKKIQFKD